MIQAEIFRGSYNQNIDGGLRKEYRLLNVPLYPINYLHAIGELYKLPVGDKMYARTIKVI